MRILIATFVSGLLFGIGLAVSGMTNPARVAGFLDITGDWDITLMFVMGGALMVTGPLFHFIEKRPRPFFKDTFHLPWKKAIDWQLVVGSSLFGIGWGIAGFCPGPAIAGLVTLSPEILMFVTAMVVGQLLARFVEGGERR